MIWIDQNILYWKTIELIKRQTFVFLWSELTIAMGWLCSRADQGSREPKGHQSGNFNNSLQEIWSAFTNIISGVWLCARLCFFFGEIRSTKTHNLSLGSRCPAQQWKIGRQTESWSVSVYLKDYIYIYISALLYILQPV